MKFKFMAIKFINYIQNNVTRDGGSSRLFGLLGIERSAVDGLLNEFMVSPLGSGYQTFMNETFLSDDFLIRNVIQKQIHAQITLQRSNDEARHSHNSRFSYAQSA